jgi:hypothetical protein
MWQRFEDRRNATYANVVQFYTVVLFATVPVWGYMLLLYSGDEALRSAFVFIMIFVLCFAAFKNLAGSDGRLLRLLTVGLGFKIACSLAYLWVNNEIWDQQTDLSGYFETGRILAERFWMFGALPIVKPLVSTKFAASIVGSLFVVTGPSMTIGCVAFAVIAFWGQYFYYRAFCTAFPKGNRFLAAILIFLLPSIAFWPAVMGKDALLEFSLGLSVYGFALLTRGRTMKSYLAIALGLLITSMARPHMGAILGLPMFVAIMFTNPVRGIAIPLQKSVAALLLLAGSAYLVSRGEEFVKIDSLGGATTMMTSWSQRTRTGSSSFDAGSSIAMRIAYSPLLAFRPLPWEIHNGISAIASLEGVFLFGLMWRKRPLIGKTIRHAMADGFVLFTVLYSVEFAMVFAASISNFGLLARQRVMALPVMCMILTAELAPKAARAMHERVRIPGFKPGVPALSPQMRFRRNAVPPPVGEHN